MLLLASVHALAIFQKLYTKLVVVHVAAAKRFSVESGRHTISVASLKAMSYRKL